MSERILFVDDNVETQKLVQTVLARQNLEVLSAFGGEQALLLAQKEQPDLILMDLLMPGMDGLEVIRRLRGMSSTAHIPIIIFTVKTDLKTKSAGFEAGADDYLTKLTTPAEVSMRIRAALRRIAAKRAWMVGVLSARGGLGVSTVTFNLAVSLQHRTQEKVIAADFRPGQGAIGMLAGFGDAGGLANLLQLGLDAIGADKVEQQLLLHSSGVSVLPASTNPRDAQWITSTGHFELVARYLASLARYVIVDLGPSLPPSTAGVLGQLDQVVVVIEPNPQTITQSKLLLEALRGCGVVRSKISVVSVNRGGSGLQLPLSQIEDSLGSTPLVVVPPAAELAYRAANEGTPIVLLQPGSLIAEQFGKLASIIREQAQLTH
jgi:DNA-binding response OmpR family regulator